MSIAEAPRKAVTESPKAGAVDLKLEVVIIPVSDVARAAEFYAALGWRVDLDLASDTGRAVHFTPPGSQCSVMFGTGMSGAAPGSAQNNFLVVSDIVAAREALIRNGAKPSEVFHDRTGGYRFDPDSRAIGLDPDRRSYASFLTFSDPDGNSWLLQEVTTRLPGRIDSNATSFSSTADLANAMRRAAAAHGEHEARIGGTDANWPDWYATYIAAEQSGEPLPS
jgi:catechol 2,3-dioxygenase-like lactoylglutathione lyase family enzyme